MFKKIFLIVILQLFAHCCGKSIYRDESNGKIVSNFLFYYYVFVKSILFFFDLREHKDQRID